MAGFFSAVSLAAGNGPVLQVFSAIVLLFLGHIGVKLAIMAMRRFWIRGHDLNKKQVEERNEAIQYTGYALDGVLIVAVLLYLNTGLTSQVATDFVNFLPSLLSAILIGLLGIIAINITLRVGREFLSAFGVKSYFRDIGLSSNALNVVSLFFKSFLYLLLLQIALEQLGIGETFIGELVTASSWAIAFLIAGLLFYGFKDLLQDFAAGIYLKNSRNVRPGEEVTMDDTRGEIREVSLFSTTVNTEKGYVLMAPNSKVMNSDIRFKRTKSDIETLEDIKNYFIAEEPGHTGPASVEMALEIFGHSYTQEEILEEAEEGQVQPDELVDLVSGIAGDEIGTAYVEHGKVSDLADEMKAWFEEGALLVPYFSKEDVFPDSDGDYYALAVAVEGDEILVVDPSDDSGGVYYIEKQRIHDAMEGKGYIVLAPEGTTAHWRIKNDLVYSESNYYDELSKTLETRLRKLLRKGRILSDAMPGSVQKYMDNWRAEEHVSRVWKPGQEGEDEASEDN